MVSNNFFRTSSPTSSIVINIATSQDPDGFLSELALGDVKWLVEYGHDAGHDVETLIRSIAQLGDADSVYIADLLQEQLAHPQTLLAKWRRVAKAVSSSARPAPVSSGVESREQEQGREMAPVSSVESREQQGRGMAGVESREQQGAAGGVGGGDGAASAPSEVNSLLMDGAHRLPRGLAQLSQSSYSSEMLSERGSSRGGSSELDLLMSGVDLLREGGGMTSRSVSAVSGESGVARGRGPPFPSSRRSSRPSEIDRAVDVEAEWPPPSGAARDHDVQHVIGADFSSKSLFFEGSHEMPPPGEFGEERPASTPGKKKGATQWGKQKGPGTGFAKGASASKGSPKGGTPTSPGAGAHPQDPALTTGDHRAPAFKNKAKAPAPATSPAPTSTPASSKAKAQPPVPAKAAASPAETAAAPAAPPPDAKNTGVSKTGLPTPNNPDRILADRAHSEHGASLCLVHPIKGTHMDIRGLIVRKNPTDAQETVLHLHRQPRQKNQPLPLDAKSFMQIDLTTVKNIFIGSYSDDASHSKLGLKNQHFLDEGSVTLQFGVSDYVSFQFVAPNFLGAKNDGNKNVQQSDDVWTQTEDALPSFVELCHLHAHGKVESLHNHKTNALFTMKTGLKPWLKEARARAAEARAEEQRRAEEERHAVQSYVRKMLRQAGEESERKRLSEELLRRKERENHERERRERQRQQLLGQDDVQEALRKVKHDVFHHTFPDDAEVRRFEPSVRAFTKDAIRKGVERGGPRAPDEAAMRAAAKREAEKLEARLLVDVETREAVSDFTRSLTWNVLREQSERDEKVCGPDRHVNYRSVGTELGVDRVPVRGGGSTI